MQISLKNKDKTPMWFLPGTRIHLSFENPGPVEIDFDSLSSQNKNQIVLAINRGLLEGKLPFTTRVEPQPLLVNKEIIEIAPPIVETFNIAPAKEMEVTDYQKEKVKELKKFLNKSWVSIKKNIRSFSLSDLKTMIALEKEGKDRKVVKDLIDEVLSLHQSQVLKNISIEETNVVALDTTKTTVMSGLKREHWNNIGDIVESEEEAISFKLGE